MELPKSLLFAWPIQPGKEEAWRRAIQEIQESRQAEYAESRLRLGIRTESIRLVQSGPASFAIVTIHANEPGHLLQTMATSKHPFDRWFRSQVLEYHGIDLSRRRSSPEAEVIMAWKAPTANSDFREGAEVIDPSGGDPDLPSRRSDP